MQERRRVRLMAAGALVPLVVVLAACGGGDSDADADAGSASCPSNINDKASTALPSDVPSPEGASTAFQYSKQGETQVWFFAVSGSPDDLESLRDSYDDTLKSKGYDIKDTDQEEGAEAESEFDGPHDGTTNFRPSGCEGKVTFRLKLES
jgi:hypothetical protein